MALCANNATRWQGRLEMCTAINANEQPMAMVIAQLGASASAPREMTVGNDFDSDEGRGEDGSSSDESSDDDFLDEDAVGAQPKKRSLSAS